MLRDEVFVQFLCLYIHPQLISTWRSRLVIRTESTTAAGFNPFIACSIIWEKSEPVKWAGKTCSPSNTVRIV